jgi:hypothetical protein
MLKFFTLPYSQGITSNTASRWARMRSWLCSLLIFNFSLLISNCGLDIEDPTPPSPPTWVQKSLPEEWPERGIDAHESGGIYLEWLSNPTDEDVQSYMIFRMEYFDAKDSLSDYELLSRIETEISNTGEYIVPASPTNRRYYYVLVAEDAAECQSTPSDTLNYMRFTALRSDWMFPNGLSSPLDPDRELKWHYYYAVEMENFTLTVLNAENNLILRRELTPSNYVGGVEVFTIPDTIVLLSGNVYKWRVDLGACYVAGRETAGSESPWATFLYTAP